MADFIGPEVHAQAFERWGYRAQLMALMEELAEAAAAVSRHLNGKGPAHAVLEELVDVESLRLSLADQLGSENDWTAMQQTKRAKLLRKLTEGVKRV